MKEYEGLINYLTNIILRPHRQTYGIQKLGPPKIVVKSHEKGLSMLQSMYKNEKNLPKQIQQNYCQLIEVNRKQVTIKRDGKNIQVSIYQPQLTCLSNRNTDNQNNIRQKVNQNGSKANFLPKKNCQQVKYNNCVVLLHANSGSRLEGTQYAKHVLQYRTLCVSFDYTGSGISEGQYTTMGVNQSKDLSSVINFIAETYNVKKFSLWGRSMGAVTGIYYLLTKYKEDSNKIRVASCVIDSPFSHLEQLIKEIASRKSSLPQFVFQPILKVIENDIISKIGVNIFTQLNLVQKIKNLNSQETKLLNSVSFLGLASKNDTMIDHQHCQELCSLLISEEARRSDDEKSLLVTNSFDKHFMMLVEFKKQINTKGDFIQIEGDHNKPRSNQVKEKVSFFIHDNFYNFKDLQLTKNNQSIANGRQNSISFTKTGVSIKAKLSFAKPNGMKPRKDPTMNSEMTSEQNKTQDSFSRHNYNLINLKEIKAKQVKQSISKEKQNVHNSLTKIFMLKDRKTSFQTAGQNTKSIDSVKGLSIVSKEFHRERMTPNEQGSRITKKAYETLQNSKNFSNKLQSGQKTSFQNNQKFTHFLTKLKGGALSKNQNQHEMNSIEKSPNYSDKSGSVNNSLKKQESDEDVNDRQEIIITPLQLPENPPEINTHENLTQRPRRSAREVQTLSSQRVERSNRTQPYDYDNNSSSKKEPTVVINTSPFDITSSINNKSNKVSVNIRNSMDEPFKKKDSSKLIMQSIGMSTKKQPSKQPQVKISLSEFKNRQQESIKMQSTSKKTYQQQKKLMRKQNNPIQANTPTATTNWTQSTNSMNILQLESRQSICSEDKLSEIKDNLAQFIKKRDCVERDSIHLSDVSCQDSFNHYCRVQITQNNNRSFLQYKRQQNTIKNVPNTINSNYHHQSSQKDPNESNLFTCETNSMSIKQMMISNGHKGMTQSSTFNYSQQNQQNAFNQFYYPNQQFLCPNNNGQSYQYVNANNIHCMNNHQQQFYANDDSIHSQSQNQFYVNGNSNQWQRNLTMQTGRSLNTSHDPNSEEFIRAKQFSNSNNKITMSAIQSTSTLTQQNYYPIHYHQQTQYITSPGDSNIWYVPHEGFKHTIEYKKKINKLLD